MKKIVIHYLLTGMKQHNKCYEIYRQENVDGTLRNEYTNQEDCENDGYGKWLSDKNICLKININKSDCLLSDVIKTNFKIR